MRAALADEIFKHNFNSSGRGWEYNLRSRKELASHHRIAASRLSRAVHMHKFFSLISWKIYASTGVFDFLRAIFAVLTAYLCGSNGRISLTKIFVTDKALRNEIPTYAYEFSYLHCLRVHHTVFCNVTNDTIVQHAPSAIFHKGSRHYLRLQYSSYSSILSN